MRVRNHPTALGRPFPPPEHPSSVQCCVAGGREHANGQRGGRASGSPLSCKASPASSSAHVSIILNNRLIIENNRHVCHAYTFLERRGLAHCRLRGASRMDAGSSAAHKASQAAPVTYAVFTPAPSRVESVGPGAKMGRHPAQSQLGRSGAVSLLSGFPVARRLTAILPSVASTDRRQRPRNVAALSSVTRHGCHVLNKRFQVVVLTCAPQAQSGSGNALGRERNSGSSSPGSSASPRSSSPWASSSSS